MLFHVTVPSRFSWTKVQVSRWSAGATRSKANPAPFSVSWDRRWGSEVFKVAIGGECLMPAPHPPGWSSGALVVGKCTSSLRPHPTWGRRRECERPSVTGVGGWLGGLVSGSRSPGVEPLASEAGPTTKRC